VVSRHAARPLAGRGHRRDRERGSVGREDTVALHHFFETGEELPLGGEVLDDGLHHEMRRRQPIQGVHDIETAQGVIHLRCPDPTLLDELAQALSDRILGSLRGAGLAVEHQGTHAALRQDLRDAAAHGPGAGHAGDEIAAVGI
jgi:hypothetical protein